MTEGFDSAEYILYPYFTAEKFKTDPQTGVKAYAVIRWDIAKRPSIRELIEKHFGQDKGLISKVMGKDFVEVTSSKDISVPLSRLISETTPYGYILPEKLEPVLKRIYDFD
jgi:hypothetical protein